MRGPGATESKMDRANPISVAIYPWISVAAVSIAWSFRRRFHRESLGRCNCIRRPRTCAAGRTCSAISGSGAGYNRYPGVVTAGYAAEPPAVEAVSPATPAACSRAVQLGSASQILPQRAPSIAPFEASRRDY